jgi:hypothetical protein
MNSSLTDKFDWFFMYLLALGVQRMSESLVHYKLQMNFKMDFCGCIFRIHMPDEATVRRQKEADSKLENIEQEMLNLHKPIINSSPIDSTIATMIGSRPTSIKNRSHRH